jgi:hypothetical protein
VRVAVGGAPQLDANAYVWYIFREGEIKRKALRHMTSRGFFTVEIFGDRVSYQTEQGRPASVLPRLGLACMDLVLAHEQPTTGQWADHFDKDRHILEPCTPDAMWVPAHHYEFSIGGATLFRFRYLHREPGTNNWQTVLDTDDPARLLEEALTAALAVRDQTIRLRRAQGWTEDEPVTGIPTVSALNSRAELLHRALELFTSVVSPCRPYTEPDPTSIRPRDESMSEIDYLTTLLDWLETQAMIHHDIGAMAREFEDHAQADDAHARRRGFLVAAYKTRAALERL